MIAACATACIIARANRDQLDVVQGQKLAIVYTRETGYLCNPVGYRWWLLNHGVRSTLALDAFVQWANMYAAGVYHLPANCGPPSGG